MYILGIDPGTGRTGWGVIKVEEGNKITYVAHGCIITTLDDLMHNRLKILHEELSYIIKTHTPVSMVVEQIFFGGNARTAISVSQARGVILLTGAQNNLPTHEYTPISVKKLISGSGKAEKKDMQLIVRELLNLTDDVLSFSAKDHAFDDAADALAIAINHAWREIGYVPTDMRVLVATDLKREKKEQAAILKKEKEKQGSGSPRILVKKKKVKKKK